MTEPVTAYLAVAPQPSWAGVITAFGTLLTALALVITATGGAIAIRATNRRAAEAAALLLQSQQETIRRTNEVAVQVAETTTRTNAKLDVIHTLVNSTLTAAMQNELDATKRELLIMREVAKLRAAADPDADPDSIGSAAITVLERKVGELALAMRERLEQASVAEQQIATEAARVDDQE